MASNYDNPRSIGTCIKTNSIRSIHIFVILITVLADLSSITAWSRSNAFSKAGTNFAALKQSTHSVQGEVVEIVKGKSSPLAGVTILEKGTSNGTVSDLSGKFTISVKSNAVLIITMIGYKKQEIAIDNRSMITITLEDEASILDEIVVTGYQNIDKKLFTGSTVNLKGAEIKQDGVNDVSRMLEGRAAGVSVQNVSGTFGSAPKIRIRGATSIYGNNKPLWVIDGVVLEDVVNVSNEQLTTGDTKTLIGSAVAGLNPDDIESFQILKDASATSQYGARAMNGVIVITTKKGSAGKTTVSFSSNMSTYLKPSFTNYNIMNSADQMEMYLELERKGWISFGASKRNADGGVFTKMYDLIDSYDSQTGEFGLPNTPDAKSAFLARYAMVNTDWFDVLFQNSLKQEHSLSVSSGTPKSQLYVSMSTLTDNGWTIADQVKRYTANARANFSLTDKLALGILMQGSIRDQVAPGAINRRSDPVEGKYDRDFDINPFSYALNTSRTITPYDDNGNPEYFRRNFAPFNILNELQKNRLELNVIDLKLQGDASYEIIPGLKYSILGSLRYAKTSREHKVHEASNMAEAYRAAGDNIIRQSNRFLYRNPDNPEAEPIVVLPYGGFYNTFDDFLVTYNVRHTINYSKTFNATHIINLIALQEARYADRQSRFNYGFGYQYDKGGVPYVDPNIIKQLVEGNFDFYGLSKYYDRFLAWMINGTYSYKGKYNATATIRYDGSNLLGQSRSARWLPTWNISGSWNLDAEEFMKGNQTVDRLTLRATYGLTASMGQASNSSLFLETSKTPRPYLPEIESVISISDLENRNLTWEKQYEMNVGVDAGLLGERLTLTVDMYQRDGFDLIGPIRTSGIGGQYIKLANYADTRSSGLEITLGGTAIQRGELSWRPQITLSTNKNRITHLDYTPIMWELVGTNGGGKVGAPIRGLYSIDFYGLGSSNGFPLLINEKGEVSTKVDLQSDESRYLKYEGPIDATLAGGFYNTVTYKHWSLSVLFTYSGGNKVRLNPAFNNIYSDLASTPREFLSRWVATGEEGLTNIPSIADAREIGVLEGYNPFAVYNYSSQRVADGDYIRLKQVSVGYTLPAKWLTPIHAQTGSISLAANNLLLLYSDKKLHGQDPEFLSSGGVALPVPKQLTLSLKVSF